MVWIQKIIVMRLLPKWEVALPPLRNFAWRCFECHLYSAANEENIRNASLLKGHLEESCTARLCVGRMNSIRLLTPTRLFIGTLLKSALYLKAFYLGPFQGQCFFRAWAMWLEWQVGMTNSNLNRASGKTKQLALGAKEKSRTQGGAVYWTVLPFRQWAWKF